MEKSLPGGPGLLFGPGPQGSWDSERVSSPRVLLGEDGVWRMWYYGRDPSFDRMINLPTGRCGLAVSDDGIHWRRQPGPGVMGSVFDPSEDDSRFDCGHVGVSDVVRDGDAFYMWYFGGSKQIQQLGKFEVRGFDLRPGVAVSRDGLNWYRIEGPYQGAMMDIGEGGQFRGWPQLVKAGPADYRLYYHGLSMAEGFRVGVATSSDGFHFEDQGPVLGKGAEGSFDAWGCATRHVMQHQGSWLMFYEGVQQSGDRSIGLARSDDGLSWTKVPGPEPDGSVLAHSSEPDAWDNHGMGCPCVVALPDGGLRLYYIGSCPLDGRTHDEMGLVHQIGLAISDGDPTRWTRWTA